MTIEEVNQATSPPLIVGSSQACNTTLAFKPAIAEGFDDMHAFLVISRPDGSKTEVRGGPSQKGSGTSSEAGPVGNPFACPVATKWGVVVPYIGPHGKLGTDGSGAAVYSPDGNVPDPKGTTVISKTLDGKKACVIANCIMQVVHAAGKTCQPYTVGVGELRNSNTLVSFALSACGVKDPLPAGITATGWGSAWYTKQ
ncbi:hypothetical protein EZ313_22055 [Ramlibacter henchirensis]|uniref:Uncharacterized protein n=1 Tax=Ramlibacter henchirensis TaxID=204072 RepID=A0A4Z0BKF3_9BURK|nr:hypothetical protein [Ramlibacter henchirensis]TFY99251.1 hypothetical protein EZ313_22055 [Ramlibacter henchirensis]